MYEVKNKTIYNNIKIHEILRLNLTVCVQNFIENSKAILRDIKEYINKWEVCHVNLFRRHNVLMTLLCKLYRFNAVPIKIPLDSCVKLDKLTLNLYGNSK